MLRALIANAWPSDALGLPPAPRSVERVCRVVALVCSLGFAVAVFWEVAGPFGAGHYASASAVCTASENMWRWGIGAPVPHYSLNPPHPSEYYCHHPWGIFWISAPFLKLFGHHAWACRLPALLQSAFTPPLLYLAGRALYGPVAGAVAAAAFSALPIALSFGNFNSLEVPLIFGTLLAIWSYARLLQTFRRRFLALGLFGLLWAVNSDWPGFLFGAGLIGVSFVCAFLPKRRAPARDLRRLSLFWGLGVVICALSLAGHLYAFQRAGKLFEFWNQGSMRSAGSDEPLAQVLASRRYWIELSFTGLAVALGKLALPVIVLRSLILRSELEFLPMLVFGLATFEYVVFKQGADVHIFWPHCFAEYFALALAALTQTGLSWSTRAALRFWPGSAAHVALGWLGLGLLVPLAILPDGLRELVYARKTGGRFNEKGNLIKPDKDKAAALAWLSERMQDPSGVALHPGMRQSLWVDWTLRRPVRTVPSVPSTPAAGLDRYFIGDLRFMSAGEQETLAQNFALLTLGPFVAVDREAPKAPLQAFAIRAREPSWVEAYVVSGTHALQSVAADAFLTWELRARFAQTPNDPPAATPQGFEQLRIAHNIAVSRGDASSAQHWLDALLIGVDRTHQLEFKDGSRLLGSRLVTGTSPLLYVYFEAGSANTAELALSVRSVVDSAPRFSLVPKDDVVQQVSMPFLIPPGRWQKGHVYASITELLKRPGRERFYVSVRGLRAELVTPVSGRGEVSLLTLE